MAKSKAGQKHGQASAGNGGESPEQIYASALALAEQSQFEEALEEAQKLWARVKESSVTQKLPALNLLGEISVELGDVERAQEYFMEAVKLDPEGTIPETVGGGAEKFLWLAQLCEEGGNVSVQWFEKGAQALQHEISELENGTNGGLDDETIMMMRIEKKKKLANALCGIIEVYMTDLSWEDDAEARCEMLITQAMSVEEETSPEVLQTLASIRLSQERKEDAQAALKRSITSWEELEPEDPAVPDFATRISLARLLMEADLESTAMSVIERLVTEDDSSVEAWYLGGWCQHLIAERLRTSASSQPTSDSADAVTIALKASRHWLRQSLKLYALLEYEDDRLFAHAQELVSELDQTLGPAEDTNDDIFEEWDGIEENNADATNDDEEMQDL